MTETLYISKESKDKFSTDEVINTFTNSDNLDEIRKCVEKAEERLFVSWASVDGVDNDKEKIPIGLVIKAQDELMKRGAPIMYRHTNKNVGKTLTYKVAQHPKTGKLGVLHLNKIYDSMPIDDEVWNDIKEGKLKGLSVGGQGVIGSKEYDDDLKSLVEVYSSYGQYETSIVKDPSNPLALNEAYSNIAKEKKMDSNQEVKIEDVVKELKESMDSIKKEVSEIKEKSFTKEEQSSGNESNSENSTQETSTENVEKEEGKNSLSLEDVSSQIGELKKMVGDMYKAYTKESKDSETERGRQPQEEGDTEDSEKKTKDSKKENSTENVEKESKELEKESKDVEKEETFTTEAPSTKKPEEGKTVDIHKEYESTMADFEAGKISYEEVLSKFRGNQ